jgi:hypothetical protein
LTDGWSAVLSVTGRIWPMSKNKDTRGVHDVDDDLTVTGS